MWWIIWGYSTVPRELGVVADLCPHCGCLSHCCVIGEFQRAHIYFITFMEEGTRGECLCSACGGGFPCELWRYREFLPAVEADTMTQESLLERTNLGLKERLLWAQQQRS
jgi:hypothetical protein